MPVPSPLRVVFVLAPLIVAACQPLPHPFEDNHPPPASPIMSPPDAAGIVVRPVTGAPSPANTALAEAMADALRNEDVPSDTDASNRRSYHLAASVRTEPAGDQTRVTVEWRLAAADGHVVGSETTSAVVPAVDWQRGDTAVAKTLVAKLAPTLARSVEGDVPVEHIPHAPIVALAPMVGAPGDGGRSLIRAMSAALPRAGIELPAKPADQPNFALGGKITMGPPKAGKQEIKIVWVVSKAGGGPEIGQVTQENEVPAGSLDGPWGDIAYDVVTAALPGVVALIQRAQGVVPAGS